MAKKASKTQTTETAVVAPKAVKQSVSYRRTENKANPKAAHNKDAWDAVLATLAENNGVATYEQLTVALIAVKDKWPQIAPNLMIPYLVDCHWIEIVKVEAPATSE